MKLAKLITLGTMILGIALPCYAEKIVVEGSTTVLPIAQKAAEVFMNNNAGADISVRGGGSGVGIASLIDGTTTNCIGIALKSIDNTTMTNDFLAFLKTFAKGKNNLKSAFVIALHDVKSIIKLQATVVLF